MMTPCITCEIPECGEFLIVDYRHLENLEATPWLCHQHVKESQRLKEKK